jgi:hypothetical protein
MEKITNFWKSLFTTTLERTKQVVNLPARLDCVAFEHDWFEKDDGTFKCSWCRTVIKDRYYER